MLLQKPTRFPAVPVEQSIQSPSGSYHYIYNNRQGETLHSTLNSSNPAKPPELLAKIPKEALVHPVNATTSVPNDKNIFSIHY